MRWRRGGPTAIVLAAVILVPDGHRTAAADEVIALEIQEGVPVNRLLVAADTDFPSTFVDFGDDYAVSAIRSLRPGGLRFPGGLDSNYWDLAKSEPVALGRLARVNDGKKPTLGDIPLGWKWLGEIAEAGKPRTMTDFAGFCRDVGATPIWVMNLVTTLLPEDLAVVKHCDSAGVVPRYVELGSNVQSSANKYLPRCHAVSRALRKRFPEVRIGVSGGDLLDWDWEPNRWRGARGRQTTGPSWSDRLYRGRKSFDAFTVDLPALNERKFEAAELQDHQWVQYVLLYPEAVVERLASKCRERYGEIELWVYSYDLELPAEPPPPQVRSPFSEPDGPTTVFLRGLEGHPLQMVHAATYVLAAIRNHDVFGMMCYDGLFSIVGEELLLEDVGPTKRLRVSATGQWFAHLGALAEEAETMHAISVTEREGVRIPVVDRKRFDTLIGAAFRGPDRTSLVLVNRATETVRARIPPTHGLSKASICTYHTMSRPHNAFARLGTGNPAVRPWTFPVETSVREASVSPGQPLVVEIPRAGLVVVRITR